MFQHIFVPIDGSEHSRRAVQAAMEISRGFGAGGSITLLHVCSSLYTYPDAELILAAIKENERRGQELLAVAAEPLRNAGLHVRTLLETGAAAQRICAHVKEEDYDLVVMGSRGLGTIGEMLLGSCSHKVLHEAPCPVMIVK